MSYISFHIIFYDSCVGLSTSSLWRYVQGVRTPYFLLYWFFLIIMQWTKSTVGKCVIRWNISNIFYIVIAAFGYVLGIFCIGIMDENFYEYHTHWISMFSTYNLVSGQKILRVYNYNYCAKQGSMYQFLGLKM